MTGSGRLCPLCNETLGADFCPTHGVPTLVIAELEGPPAPIELGTVIGGRYRIERLLSQGGMGAVLIATQLGIGRTVVVKVVKTAKDALLNHLRRFYREAIAMSRLNHPNIVRVHEFGVDLPTRTPFLIMEHVEGRTLRDIVDEEGPLPERRAARLLGQVARALFEAHNHGVLHRDLKPRNIMVRSLADGDELIKVLDFGLAKIAEDDNPQPPLTQPGKTIGTPSYMSPEQVVSAEQDGRTDLYGLGCVLHMVLTGAAPFVGTDLIDTMRMHLNKAPPPLPERLSDGQPPSDLLCSLYGRLLAKRKTDRPESAAEVARDLMTIAEGRLEIPKIQPLPHVDRERDVITTPSAHGLEDSDALVTIPAEGTLLTELGGSLPESRNLADELGSGVGVREKTEDSMPSLPPTPPEPRRLGRAHFVSSSGDNEEWTTVLPSSLNPADSGLTPNTPSELEPPPLERPARATPSRPEPLHLQVPEMTQAKTPTGMIAGGAALLVAGIVLGFLYAPKAETEVPPHEEDRGRCTAAARAAADGHGGPRAGRAPPVDAQRRRRLLRERSAGQDAARGEAPQSRRRAPPQPRAGRIRERARHPPGRQPARDPGAPREDQGARERTEEEAEKAEEARHLGRSGGPGMVRARVLALVTTCACSADLGIEATRYHCDNDAQCAAGYACDPALAICTESSERPRADAGEPTCGFDEDFSDLDVQRWRLNGSAAAIEGGVELTPAEPNRRGTIWYTHRIDAERFRFEMVFRMFDGGTSGGEGMTMAWIEEDAAASGGGGANLGVYGLHGYVVELDTLSNVEGDPNAEHIAFSRTTGALLPSVDRFGVVTGLPSLRSANARTLAVDFDGAAVQIALDGVQVMTATVAGDRPFSATFGATAATGARFDAHTVRRLTLTCR